jgi:hypothetical protein
MRRERTWEAGRWPARYTLGDNKLGDCCRRATTLAWRVLYFIAGGGDLQEARSTGRPTPRSRSELAGSSEHGRGYEPRLKRQRTVLYDRLAWTTRTTSTEHPAPKFRIQIPPWDGGTALGRTAIRTRSVVLTHRDPSPGVLRTPVSREVGQHWGMSRLRSRHALTGVRFLSRCSARPTPESDAHTAPPLGSPPGGGSFLRSQARKSLSWRKIRLSEPSLASLRADGTSVALM